MERIAVIGAGTMGHGIAQVCAMAGYQVCLTDVNADVLAKGMRNVALNLDKGVARGKVSQEVRDKALAGLRSHGQVNQAVANADMVIEAVPERLQLKQSIFKGVEAHIPSHCILGTNTSSLAVGEIASVLQDPSRVIGTHFFNPVHIMPLLELVVADRTRPDVVEATKAFGERIGKSVITVRDYPGFATSRLGVCLGMEAIRMVEQGVASPEDIDTAMVLGYRHPVGPLKLTDMVGLDVRIHIGEYLADRLGNPAYKPPALMRRMVSEGKLGKKTGQGFYSWET